MSERNAGDYSEPSTSYREARQLSESPVYGDDAKVGCVDGVVVAIGENLTREELARKFGLLAASDRITVLPIGAIRRHEERKRAS